VRAAVAVAEEVIAQARRAAAVAVVAAAVPQGPAALEAEVEAVRSPWC
jgi:hypothetical protein